MVVLEPPSILAPLRLSRGLRSLFPRRFMVLCAFLIALTLSSRPASAQTPLVNGGSIGGSITAAGQVDSFSFSINAGEGFQLRVADANATSLTPKMLLYNPSGAPVFAGGGSGGDVAWFSGSAAATGTYTIDILDQNGTGTGSYLVYFTRAPGANEGGALVNGGSIAGTIELGDLDSYTFDVNAGEGYHLRVADTNSTSLAPKMYLYDPAGSAILPGVGAAGDVAWFSGTASSTGTHTIVIADFNKDGTGGYEVHFARAPGANEGGALVNGGTLNGFIDLGDLDSFTYTALAGESIDLQMVETPAASLTPQMWLYGPTGAPVTSDWGPSVATIATTAAATGTYTLVLCDLNKGGIGPYSLSFTRGLETYCTPGTTTSGCSSSMSAIGDPSASAGSGFDIHATGGEGNKDGLFFFGTNGRQANSWGNGSSFQCVVPPVKRTPLVAGVGTNGNCDGHLTFDFNALITATPAKAPPVGAVVQMQCWYRDPFNTSNQSTSLSDALEFTQKP